MVTKLPIEPPEPEFPPEMLCDVCGEPVDDYSRYNTDSYIYEIDGYRMCRGCAEKWLNDRRVSVYD